MLRCVAVLTDMRRLGTLVAGEPAMPYRIFGIGDDVVVVEGDRSGEVKSGDAIVIGTSHGGIVVALCYPAREVIDGVEREVGVWQAMVHQVDEDVPVPWPVSFSTARPNGYPPSVYSIMVTVACPLGTPISGGKFSP